MNPNKLIVTGTILLSVLLIFFLTAVSHFAAEDPLPSWNDTAPKRAIIQFVTDTTRKGGPKFVPSADRTVPPPGRWSPAVPGSRAGTHHAGAGWSRWQAGHASLPSASADQPAATARARLSASPSAAGSAKAARHPAMAHRAAGTRIWSPMTQCPVIATG